MRRIRRSIRSRVDPAIIAEETTCPFAPSNPSGDPQAWGGTAGGGSRLIVSAHSSEFDHFIAEVEITLESGRARTGVSRRCGFEIAIGRQI